MPADRRSQFAPGSSELRSILRSVSAAIVLIAVLLAAACNDGGSGGSPSEPPAGDVALALTATPSAIPSDGATQITVRATRNGAPVAVTVQLATTLGHLDDTQLTTGNDGRAATTLHALGASGTARV